MKSILPQHDVDHGYRRFRYEWGAEGIRTVSGRSWYLAGPMRGIPEFNFPFFDEAAANLRDMGATVWSPAENDREALWAAAHPGYNSAAGDTGGDPLPFFMEEDLAQVCRADGVVVLPGWAKSTGSVLEVLVARYLNKPVIRYGTWTKVGRIPDLAWAINDRLRRATY